MTRQAVLLSAVVMLLGLRSTAAAQGRITLTATGGPVTFPAPTAADYDAGFVLAAAPLAFTVDASGGPATQRTATVSVQATTPFLGGTKPVADLQWRRADLGTWNPLTVGSTGIESHPMVRNGLNDPWSNSVYFRMNLGWASDGPGTYTTGVVLTLTVTTP